MALRHATAYHHEPHVLNHEFRKNTTFVYVADTICGKLQHGYYLTSQAQDVTTDMLDVLGIDEATMGEVCQELPEQIAEAEQVLVDNAE